MLCNNCWDVYCIHITTLLKYLTIWQLHRQLSLDLWCTVKKFVWFLIYIYIGSSDSGFNICPQTTICCCRSTLPGLYTYELFIFMIWFNFTGNVFVNNNLLFLHSYTSYSLESIIIKLFIIWNSLNGFIFHIRDVCSFSYMRKLN